MKLLMCLDCLKLLQFLALLHVCYRDLYEFDLYDLFEERFTHTNRGIAVHKARSNFLTFLKA